MYLSFFFKLRNNKYFYTSTSCYIYSQYRKLCSTLIELLMQEWEAREVIGRKPRADSLPWQIVACFRSEAIQYIALAIICPSEMVWSTSPELVVISIQISSLYHRLDCTMYSTPCLYSVLKHLPVILSLPVAFAQPPVCTLFTGRGV